MNSYVREKSTDDARIEIDAESIKVQGSNVLTALNTLTLDELSNVNSDGGLGEVVNDKLTYIGSSYPFIIAPKLWINLSTVFGSIVFENIATPYARTIAVANTYYPLLFAGTINPASFLITTNGLGRLTNTDSFKWQFRVEFSATVSSAVANNQEIAIALHKNGVQVSNSYLLTTAQAGKYASLSGYWTDSLNGSSVTGSAVANQYFEMYLKNSSGTNTINIVSAYMSVVGIKVETRPAV